MSILFRDALTVVEITGEDSEGHATTRSTFIVGTYRELTLSERRSIQGTLSSDVAFFALPPDDYGVLWSVKPSDRIEVGSESFTVSEVTAVRNPRTGTLHHIEVRGG